MDEIERLVRESNPSQIGRDTPLSARAEAELATLLETNPESVATPIPGRSGRGNRAWMTSLVAVLTLALVFAAGNVFNRPGITVAAPPLLAGAPLEGTTDEILDRLILAARDRSEEPPSGERSIVYEAWSANITVGEDTSVDMFVQPQEVERVWSDDLSGRIVARAGAVKWGAVNDAKAAEPGSVLDDTTFGPGEYPLLFLDEPPSTADGLRTYLSAVLGLTDESFSGEWFKAIQDLRLEWPLTGNQQSAVLQLIKTLPDVAVAGRVTDRLGRDGIAFTTESRADGKFRDILVFDATSGLLLSAEDVYLGGLVDIKLPAPTVLNYTAWKVDE